MTSMTTTRQRWLYAALLVCGGLGIGVLTGVAGSWVVLAALAAGTTVLLLTRSPFVGFLLVIFFLPLERIGAYESAVGTIRASQVIALVTITIWVVKTLLTKKRLRPNPTIYPLLLFLLVNGIGLLRAPNVSHAFGVLLITAFTVCVSLLVPQVVTTKKQLRRVVVVLLFSATLVSLFGLFQFLGDIVGLPVSVTGLRELYTKEIFGFPRIQSTALEPLYFANYLLLPIGLLYAFVLAKKSVLPRWLLFGLLALLLANLVLTVSRGGYLGFVASFLVISLCALRNFFRLRTLLPLVIGGVIVVVLVVKALSLNDVGGMNIETFTGHISDVFFGASYNERIETFEQARQAFWSSPFVGIGPGSFGPSVAIASLVEPVGGWRIVNNESLELLAETGMVGFGLILAVLLLLVARTVKALRAAPDGQTRMVLIGLFGALVGVLAQYQTFSVLYIMHIWVLIGLLIAVQNILLKGESS